MKNIMLFWVWMGFSFSMLAQQPLVRIYLTDGSIESCSLNEIQDISLINRTDEMIMEIFQSDGKVVYPARSVNKLEFTKDSLDVEVLSAYIHHHPRYFPIHEIDSIVFRRLETKIIDHVVVIDSGNAADILAVDTNLLILREGTSLVSEAGPGWFFVCGITPLTPYGLLRKAISVAIADSKVIIETEEASINDIVENGVISLHVDFLQDEADTSLKDVLKPGNKSADADKIIVEYKEDNLEIKGVLEYAFSFDFNLAIENFSIRQFMFQFNTSSVLKLLAWAQVKAELVKQKGSLNEFMGIPPYGSKVILTWIGYIPVVITSFVDLQYGIELSIFGRVTESVTLKNRSLIGLEYNAGRPNDQWKNLSANNFSHKYSPPELSVGGKIKFSLGPQTNTSLYYGHKALNKYAAALLFTEMDITPLKKPLCTIYVGVESAAGVDSKIKVLKYKLPYTVKVKKLVFQSNDLIESIVPAAASSGDTITIAGQGFGSHVASYVNFKFGDSFLPVDMIRATDIISWESNKIKLVVPYGFVFPENQSELGVELIVAVSGFFNNVEKFMIIRDGPFIESIKPDTVDVGEVMVVSGRKFGETGENNVISLDGHHVTDFSSWSNSEIRFIFPDEIKSGKLWIESEGKVSNKVDFVVRGPIIESIQPQNVIAGEEMIIIGKNFGDNRNDNVISYNGISAKEYLQWSNTSIILIVPEDVATGKLWAIVNGSKSNEVAYIVSEVEVIILPPRIMTYNLVAEVEHEFEAYARPDAVYRYQWDFDDGQSFHEVVPAGGTSKVLHRYTGLKEGDEFHPSVWLYDLEDNLLSKDNITIIIGGSPEEITVGNLVWMTRNLDVHVGNNWYPRVLYCKTFLDNGYCSEYYVKEHTEYGRLYDWESAIAACESIGWRLPSHDEWQKLIHHYGGGLVAGSKLKSTQTNSKIQMGEYYYSNPNGHPFWYENIDATNESGFSALPGGFYDGYENTGLGDVGYWWTADNSGLNDALCWKMYNSHGKVYHTFCNKEYGYSVRCVRDK